MILDRLTFGQTRSFVKILGVRIGNNMTIRSRNYLKGLCYSQMLLLDLENLLVDLGRIRFILEEQRFWNRTLLKFKSKLGMYFRRPNLMALQGWPFLVWSHILKIRFLIILLSKINQKGTLFRFICRIMVDRIIPS